MFLVPNFKITKIFFCSKKLDKAEKMWYHSHRINNLCGSGSVVERHLAKVNVASSNLVFRSILQKTQNFFCVFCQIWHHSQEVRQRSATPLPPVQFRVVPPRRSKLYGLLRFFYEKSERGKRARHRRAAAHFGARVSTNFAAVVKLRLRTRALPAKAAE